MAVKKSATEPKAVTASATAPVAGANADAAPSAYVVFARRFRPRGFAEVVGQSAATTALRQALSSGRIAQAYLFCGPRGVGKTSLARIVAKALNCLKGKGPNGVANEPCNECAACTSIQEGSSLDVIEMDAATNRGIEEIRSLRENVSISPAELRYKVYIIDEVHMLTREAWNAFLKTLEEPPAHVKFIFATTDPNHVPETILSRCQRYDLRRIGPADIVTRLKQICEMDGIAFEETALSRIAGIARGGLRDAESLLDQAVNLGQNKVTDAVVRELGGSASDELISEILKACAQGQSSVVLVKTHHALEAGADPEDILAGLMERVRGTLLGKTCGFDSELLEGQSHLKSAYAELAQMLSEDQLLMLLQLFSNARRQMRDAAQTRLPLEMALIRASRLGELVDLGKLVSALENAAPLPRPPEGSRPNSSGRPAETTDSRPAASATSNVSSRAPSQASGLVVARPVAAAFSANASANVSGLTREEWNKVIAAAAARKGAGSLLASALSHLRTVRLDAAAGEIVLGFGGDQLHNKDTVERAGNAAMLSEILGAVFGREVRVRAEKASALPPMSAVSAQPARPVVRSAEQPSAAESSPPDEVYADDTEVEFDPADELPLTGAPAASDDSAPDVGGDGEDGPVAVLAPRPPPPVSIPRRPVAANSADAKELAQHPLIKLVLQETDGVIVSVMKK